MHRPLVLVVPLLLGLAASARADVAADLAKARQLVQVGRYAQGREAFEKVQTDDQALQAKRALGLADCLVATGEVAKAIETLKAQADGEKAPAQVLARLAELEFGKGRWDEASALVERAIKADADNLLG